eukprot:318891-Hanusia_phi.AAC.3
MSLATLLYGQVQFYAAENMLHAYCEGCPVTTSGTTINRFCRRLQWLPTPSSWTEFPAPLEEELIPFRSFKSVER